MFIRYNKRKGWKIRRSEMKKVIFEVEIWLGDDENLEEEIGFEIFGGEGRGLGKGRIFEEGEILGGRIIGEDGKEEGKFNGAGYIRKN